MSKHTPGPWKHTYMPRLSVIHGPNGEHVADTGAWRDDEHPEMRANAHLIAAAPDLLEALELLHDETRDYVEINSLGDPWHNRSMKMARAAIAKAKGDNQ